MSARPRRLGGFAGDRSGAGAAEFAIVLPVFVLMIFGLIEFGWTQHCISSVRHATEGAARSLMLNPTIGEAALQEQVKAELAKIGDPNVTLTLQITQGATARIATLSATYVREIGIPSMATLPIVHNLRVDTVLPPA